MDASLHRKGSEMSGLRIGVYIGNLHPHEGGGYTFQAELLKALNSFVSHSNNFSFTVFGIHNQVLHDMPSLTYVQVKPSVQIKIRNRISRIFGGGHVTGWLNHFVKTNNIDLVWFVTYAYEEVDVPFCYTVWDLQHRLQPYFPEVGERREWNNRENHYSKILKRASYVFTGTQRGKEEIMMLYQVAPERVRILPLPTPSLDKIIPLPIDHLVSKKLHGQYLFYPAQFWPHKNHMIILEAIQKLKTESHLFHVYFSGSDKGVASYIKSQAIKMGIDDLVHLLGFVKQGELVSLYKHALCLVFPSMFGPDNLPPLEAALCGCPGIVADIPGAQEQYKDAVLFFNPLDANQLASRILEINNDHEMRQNLITRANARSLAYTPQNYIIDLMKVFDEFYQVSKTWKL
jgi:glycosyltransferase involved in cell wall biosynthesis